MSRASASVSHLQWSKISAFCNISEIETITMAPANKSLWQYLEQNQLMDFET